MIQLIYLGKSACLSVQMKCKIKIMQVQKDVLGDFSDRVLRHLGEHGIAQLVETNCSQTSDSILARNSAMNYCNG